MNGRRWATAAGAALAMLAGAQAAGAEAKRKPSGGGSAPPAQATLTAPYGADLASHPEQYGLSADRGTGRLLADPWPNVTGCAPYCAYGTWGGNAWVAADMPSGTWRTFTVTFRVARAHAKETINPYFQAYLVLAHGSKLTGSVFPRHWGWYCDTEAIFREGDSTAGLNATVTDREYTLTCPTYGTSVWAGVLLTVRGEAPIELDATVKSIVVR